ncbi:hypothetical protein [Parachlamydia acanthamoebae]|nr:hypothetical protein [Parachlamydia acanthamoebae]
MKQALGTYGFGLLLCCSLVQAHDIAPLGNTQIHIAPNGVPVVNIAAANQSGMSHNRFEHFNVPTQGAVLHNSAEAIQSQLAGMLAGNPNLAHGAAA